MSEIKINKAEIVTIAMNIRNDSRKLKNKIGEMQTVMDSLSESYDTENTHEILNNYKDIAGKLEALYKAFETYSIFLEKSAQIYEEIERKLVKEAAELAAHKL